MKKTLSSCLVVLMLFALVFSMNTFAATPAGGHGSSAEPFIITTDEITAWYHEGNYHLESYSSSSFSQSYAKGERLDSKTPSEGTDHTVKVEEIDAVNKEYVIIQDFGFWTGIDEDHVAPTKTSDPTARVVGGTLIVTGKGMQFVEGVTEKGAYGNELDTLEAEHTVYVKGKFSSIIGQVVPAGDLTTGGSPLIVGDEENPYSVVITSGTAQLSGYFENLEVKAGATVTITDDTYIDGDTGLTLNGTLYVSEDTTLCVNSVSVTPKTQLKFTSKAPWGVLQKGTYTAAAGYWVLGGDVTVENAFCKLDEVPEPLVMDQSAKADEEEEDVAKKESYTLTVLDGTVKAVHGNIAAVGGNVELLLAPVIDEVKDIHNVVYASGDFKSINFGDDKTLTVRAGKAISAVVEYNSVDTEYGVTPDQDTVFDHFGGKLPVAPSEATPYTYTGVYGPWEVEATEGDVVEGAGADLNVTEDGVRIAGEFNSLNTNGHPVTLAGNTVIRGGECEIVGSGANPYDLTVEDGTVTVSGSLHKLTVKGGDVTDGTANALTIVSNATAIEVSGGTLTFQNKNTSINVDGSNNVIAANITGGDFYQLKGKISAQGHTSETIYVTGEGRYHLGDVDNTEGFSSKDTPTVQVYGNTSSCVYVQNGGEAWLHAGEISFMSADSYGIWVNNGGIVHVYPNDQYGSDITADEALLCVHGDGKGTAAMWVDALGTFDIRGRGALLEEPAEGGHALFIAENANLTIDEPLAGGTFNGLVEYKNKDLADLIPYNHYLRFDGDAPVWGTTDGTFGICPTAALSSDNALGSCNTLYPELYADPAYSDMFGELGNYYTVTDAEWELRWNMKNGEDYQLPAGLGGNPVALVLDINVYNAETVKGETYYPLWGIDHKQGDLNVTGTSSLYLAGRVLTYDGFNRAHKALSGIDTAYTEYDGDTYTVNVESKGALTVADAVKDAKGIALAPESFLGGGTIFYEPNTAGETAAICSSGELKLASGKFAALAGLESSGVLLKSGTAVFGLNDEDFATESIRILGGVVDKDEAQLSQAVKVLGGTLTVNGATIGVTDPDPDLEMDQRGGENGMTVSGGLVTVNGGIITGNWAQGKGIEVDGGKAVVHGGCIYGKYQAATSRADMSVYVNGGTAALNIDEAHKQFTFDAQAAGETSEVHYLNNVRITTGNLIVGADAEGEDVTPYTYLNGTLTAEGGRTVFYDGVVKETTSVYGAETGSDFVTEFYVKDGNFGLLTIANGDGNTGSYNYLSKDAYAGDFQNKVQIHGGTYYGIEAHGLKLKNKTVSVPNVVAGWTKAFDFDEDGTKDWAPFNHYAEVVTTTRGADGIWAEVKDLQTGTIVSGDIAGGTDGKAVVVRFAPDELDRWAKAGGEYTVAVNIWYGECPESLCALFECKGAEGMAAPLTIKNKAVLDLNGFGVYTDSADAFFQVDGGNFEVYAGVSATGAYRNVIRNFSDASGAAAIDVLSGELKVSGVSGAYPTIGAVTAVRNAGKADFEQAVLRADYNVKGNAALVSTAGNVHIGDASLSGATAGALVSGGKLTVDHADAELSSLQLKGNADADMTAGKVTGTTLVATTGTLDVSGTAVLAGQTTQQSGIIVFDATASDVLQTGGTMYINGGEIDNVEMSGTVTMSDGEIKGTLTQKGGTFTLKDGEVATFVQTAGSATMNGGSITTAANTSGTFNIAGGTVAQVQQDGGDVKITAGSVGPIAQNAGTLTVSGKADAGEVTAKATFKLEGGKIAGLTQPSGEATVTGGEVTGKSSTSGTVVISGGTFADYEQTDGEVIIGEYPIFASFTEKDGKLTVSGNPVLGDFVKEGGTAELTGGIIDSFKTNDAKLADNILGSITDCSYSNPTYENDSYILQNNTELVGGIYQVDDDGTEADLKAPFAIKPGNPPAPPVTPSTGGGGGGGGAAVTPASYDIEVAEDIKNGEITVEEETAKAGDTVTFEVAAEKGFTLETLVVLDEDENEIELVNNEDGTYTFEMPASKVTVQATFMEDNSMLNFFVDVSKDDYFYDAVLWAAENGITNGIDDTHFGPYGATTRAAMVTFLWRAAGCPEPETTECAFTDVDLDSYYGKAVLWAVENGITKGTGDTTFSPFDEVTRAQAVTFLARMAGVKDDDSGYEHDFEDVGANDYFNNSVAWAAENGITDGTSATTFSPADDCLRCQIVTFLYRYFVD